MSEKPVEQIRPKDKIELSEMKDRLGSIIKQISGKNEVVVTTELTYADARAVMNLGQDPSTTWFKKDIRDPKTGKVKGFVVRIPEKILETHEDVAKGKAAHEAGHVAITRTDFIPDEVAQELGFHHQYLAVEELPTDQVVRDRFSGAGKWVDTARREYAIQGESARQTQDKLGYIPKSIQLNSLFVYGKHTEAVFGSIPNWIDADVVELYKKLRTPLESIENTLPPEGATEEEVVEKAKERYRTNYKKIWPEVKKLVEQDLETEKLRQMLQQALQEQQKEEQQGEDEQEEQESQGQEGAEGTDGKPKPGKGEKSMEEQIKEAMKSLGENFQKELEQAIKDFAEEQKKREQEKKEQEKAQQGKSDKSEIGEEPGQEQKNKEGAGGTAKPEGTESGEEEQEGGTEEEVPMKKPGEGRSEGNPIPMDKLAQKMIEALEKAYNKLPEEIKKVLEEKARKVLEELEDKFVKELAPELTKEGGETHEEFQERLEEEGQKLEAKKEKIKAHQQATEELKDIERRQAALATTREVYDKFYAGLREQDEKLYRELEEVFTPNIKKTVKLKSAGSKINLPAVFRWEASRKAGAGQVDSKIFETVHLPEKKDYVFTLLNDLSGSMSESNKSIEDFKAKILLAEVLNRLGVKNEILGFQDTVITFKKFDEELNDDIRKKMSGMLLEVEGMNPGGHNRADVNYDAPCLLEASKGLATQPGKEKFLVVISDGLPTGPYDHATGKMPDEQLKEAVNKILKNTNHKLIALGLGEDTEHVADFYPTSFPNISAEHLSEIMGDLLKDMIMNPQKYSFKEE